MTAKSRLDTELVRRGLARSREHARELVDAGRVSVGGMVATKPATGVDRAAAVTVESGEESRWVSRGAVKLAGALERFPDLLVAGRRCLDAGASTGGFTQVLLERAAAQVAAVDVGYGQLAWRLRNDPRVLVVERTNIRDIDPSDIGGPVSLVVADLSFISLTVVLPALDRCVDRDGDLVLMVKPQFEVGRDDVGPGGVVREPRLRRRAVRRVADAAFTLGWGTAGVVASPLPGPAGNVEYFLRLRREAGELGDEALDEALLGGPS